jgi:hypothetical protein
MVTSVIELFSPSFPISLCKTESNPSPRSVRNNKPIQHDSPWVPVGILSNAMAKEVCLNPPRVRLDSS